MILYADCASGVESELIIALPTNPCFTGISSAFSSAGQLLTLLNYDAREIKDYTISDLYTWYWPLANKLKMHGISPNARSVACSSCSAFHRNLQGNAGGSALRL